MAAYAIVWGIMEPLLVSFPILNKNWWIIQIGTSLLLTLILFYFLMRKRVLQRFGYGKNCSPFETDQNIYSINKNGELGFVFLKTDSNPYDYHIKADALKSSLLRYIYKESPDFLLYIEVKMVSRRKENRTTRNGWIAFKTDISVPISHTNENGDINEWHYPVIAQRYSDSGWMVINVNISQAVANTFGREKWKLDQVIQFRILGKVEIYQVIFSSVFALPGKD